MLQLNPEVLSDTDDRRPIHFVGIAGAGMSALAELFARRGLPVTGCDNNPAASADLAALGIHVVQGHDPEHVTDARAVVFTSAMPREHPELARARALGIPVIRRAEALGLAVSTGEVVGVAGTHGKTTTTVMTTDGLRAAGLDATGIVGGRVAAWNGNLRLGSDQLFVVEADEYDRSFLALSPSITAVTNVETDHLDIYADLADIRAAFVKYVSGARAVVLCADDEGANSLPVPNSAEIIRYGINSLDARLVASSVVRNGGGSTFDIVYDGKAEASMHLRMPGLHNVRNALAAIGVGIALGLDPSRVAPGIEAFTGVERRFQHISDVAGITIVDDYAHHPTEIAATIEAARTAYPGRRIVAAFQPHLYTRTRDFAADFGGSLARADSVFLTEIYAAREQPLEGISSDLIDRAIRASNGNVDWRGERPDLATALADDVRDGDVVITIGAGDITRTATELRDLLASGASR